MRDCQGVAKDVRHGLVGHRGPDQNSGQYSHLHNFFSLNHLVSSCITYDQGRPFLKDPLTSSSQIKACYNQKEKKNELSIHILSFYSHGVPCRNAAIATFRHFYEAVATFYI